METTAAELARNLASLLAEERAKATPPDWSAAYAEGFDDALCFVLDALDAHADSAET